MTPLFSALKIFHLRDGEFCFSVPKILYPAVALGNNLVLDIQDISRRVLSEFSTPWVRAVKFDCEMGAYFRYSFIICKNTKSEKSKFQH
jgi:hypothetical protein